MAPGGLNCKGHLTNNDPDIPPPTLKGYAAKGAANLTFKKLKKIRALAAGKEIVIDVTAHKDALKLPPENCSVSSLTCSQSTSWSGTLTIRRIE